ncbi:MAG: DUF4258 domain-containing protein [Bacteroidetes bacterium]|jgi:hypothetical protein|nr:DUF4258 domain-containing protein [Bacteroidota bacterium]
MTWGRRIKLYLIGFGLGCVICFVLFRNRDLSAFLPGPRVLKFISLAKKIDADSTLLCKLKCAGISIEDIRNAAATGDVDFDKSNTHKEPHHEYDMNLIVKGQQLEFYFSANMVDSTAQLLKIYPALDGSKCGCK